MCRHNKNGFVPLIQVEKEGSWQVLPHPGTSQHFSMPEQSSSALHFELGQDVLGSLMIGQKPSLMGTDLFDRPEEQVGLPRTLVPGTSSPFLSTHQQYPVEDQH
mmetsp:Transcript_30384/g.48925  ORF Transcript_30384/g.48925 Transcript_30384/m.48925 type:complete len:104 (-) Transcript_30384:226-537(-)